MLYVLVLSVVLNFFLAGIAWEFFKNSNCHIVKAENIELKAYNRRLMHELEVCLRSLENAPASEVQKN